MKTTLMHIYGTKKALEEFGAMRKTPSTSWALVKWLQDEINPSLERIGHQQNELVTLHGTKTDTGVSIRSDDPAYPAYMKDWGEYLGTEAEVAPMPVTMEELVEAISVKDAEGKDVNSISEGTLMLLEPFTKGFIMPEAAEEPAGEAAVAH